MARDTILIVEDDEPIHGPLAEFLEHNGYQVATARNGEEALAWLKDHEPPAVILLDLIMPVMSGTQFLTARRQDPRLKSIPVVLVTAWLHRWSESTAAVDDTIHKPINTEQLVRIVARYCTSSAGAPLLWGRVRAAAADSLRRGAWYRVTSADSAIVQLEVNGRLTPVPRDVVELVTVPPHRWTVVARRTAPAGLRPAGWSDQYAVCPNCTHRASVVPAQEALRCARCGERFSIAWDEAYLGRAS